jgi:hypothetical protein
MATTKRDFLAEITTEPKGLKQRTVLFGPPGTGKTTLAANFPKVVFMTDDNEDGIESLKTAGLIPPEVAVFPPATTQEDVNGQLMSMYSGEHDYETLAIDSITGLGRINDADVCDKQFNGDWSKKGFGDYGAGHTAAASQWVEFLCRLDKIRRKRNMAIVLIGHSRIRPFQNPFGANYDTYDVALGNKTWEATLRWSDMVLFLNYFTITTKASGEKAIAKGGRERWMYTENGAGYVAKNRSNLPPEIEMGNSGQEAYANLQAAIDNSNKTNGGK